MKSLRVALVQSESRVGTETEDPRDANMERAVEAIRRAANAAAQLGVSDTALGRIGIHICYDITFPEVPRVQALNGAELLINVAATAAGFEEMWEHAVYMRAVENATWYMVCSVVGNQRGDRL